MDRSVLMFAQVMTVIVTTSAAQRFMVTLLADALPARRAEHAGELPPPGKSARPNTPR